MFLNWYCIVVGTFPSIGNPRLTHVAAAQQETTHHESRMSGVFEGNRGEQKQTVTLAMIQRYKQKKTLTPPLKI